MKLYKYKALPYKKSILNKEEKEQIKYCKDILLNNRLFMAPRESLNDCFEGMAVPIHLGICGNGSYEALGLPHPIVEEDMNQYRILSLSANCKNPIMWAHYANNYAGVCFEFEFKRDIYDIHKVSYIEKQYDTIYDPEEDEIYKAVEKSLLCKSENWSYEEEYRIILRSDEKYFYFDKSELTGIIVGHRSTDMPYVQELISMANAKKIPVYYTLTSLINYEISIINKLPTELIIGSDTLENISCERYL